MEEISQIKRQWLEAELEKLKAKGISRAEIARRLDILPQQLNNIINGSRGISDKFIDSFIKEFDISLFDLSNKERRKKIPLYDVESIGGHNDVVADTDTPAGHVAEWIDAGDWFPGATAAIRHYGDS
ncbi:MAG: helix-turn-helix transcriptional regulator, partial [Bacteroidales bacterium]|nr:helix-turn-helix transcriptional regulator [Bacteroidales bacterium]